MHLLLHLLKHLLHPPQLLVFLLDELLRLHVGGGQGEDGDGALHSFICVHFTGHGLDAERPVVLVVAVVGDVLQVVHVSPDQHGPQLHEVTVGRVLHLHDAPGVEPPSDSLTSSLHHRVAADHRKWSALLQLSVLLFEVFVLVRVAVWELVDLYPALIYFLPKLQTQ